MPVLSSCYATLRPRLIRRLVVAGLLAPLLLVATAPVEAEPIRTDQGHLLSCPDPSVVTPRTGHYRYILACTSDHAANAFPLRGSNDMLHWRSLGYVFPAGHEPWWALPSPVGRYWAPAIYRIAGHWVVYFAAQFNPRRVTLRFPDGHRVAPGTFVVGVAWSRSLRGSWRTRVLHYRGQDNLISREREQYGGVIDPSQVQDPRSRQRYLFWAEQHSSIWVARLSANGLVLSPDLHQALWASNGWACNTPNRKCTIEGPEETYRDGSFYLFYSGASTWSGSYAVGAAESLDPLAGQFTPLGQGPILRSSRRWVGPGGTSAPIVGSGGRGYIFYHAMPHPDPDHISADRYLFVSPLNWRGIDGSEPLVSHGRAGIGLGSGVGS